MRLGPFIITPSSSSHLHGGLRVCIKTAFREGTETGGNWNPSPDPVSDMAWLLPLVLRGF